MGNWPLSHADRPIDDPAEDLLERKPLVDLLVSQISRAPLDAGFVVGLSGAWGSGKTSVLNLVERRLKATTPVLRFEPWLFTGTAELLSRFFDELSRQANSESGGRLREVGRQLSELGAALAPVANVVMGPAGDLATLPAQMLERRRTSAQLARSRITQRLRARGERIVVIIDDVDRLTPAEIG